MRLNNLKLFLSLILKLLIMNFKNAYIKNPIENKKFP